MYISVHSAPRHSHAVVANLKWTMVSIYLVGCAMNWLGWIFSAVRNIFSGQGSYKGTTVTDVMMGYITTIIKKWYYFITIPAIILVYKVLKTPSVQLLLKKLQILVQSGFDSAFYIVDNCLPLLANFEDMRRCIMGPMGPVLQLTLQ